MSKRKQRNRALIEATLLNDLAAMRRLLAEDGEALRDFEQAVKWQKKAMEDAEYMKLAGERAKLLLNGPMAASQSID